jgi:endoglucanase
MRSAYSTISSNRVDVRPSNFACVDFACVEFCELRAKGVLGSSAKRGSPKYLMDWRHSPMNEPIVARPARHPLPKPTRRAFIAGAIAAALALAVLGASGAVGQTATEPYALYYEGETFALNPSGAGMVMNNTNASGGKELYAWSDALASKSITLPGKADSTTIRARGELCGTEAPRVELRVDGTVVGAVIVSTTSFANYTINAAILGGAKQIALAYTNDFRSSTCDRNVRIDLVTFRGTKEAGTQEPPPPVVGGNPLAGASFYVDPNSHAKRQADQWRTSQPADAAHMDKIAAQPSAFWSGDDTPSQVQSYVSNIVTRAANAGKVPVLVPYNVPSRDCGAYSSNGAGGADEYRAWMNAFANGIGDRRAVVIIEPDAIPAMDCLSDTDRQLYLGLVGYAVDALKAKPNTHVYIDAGHSAWVPASTMIERLEAAGIARADGFSLNVSNFQITADNIAYGRQISQGVGGKHFVIDTSRNGLGAYPGTHSGNCGWWLNPPGRALGPRPTTNTGDAVVDAFLWIKYPGESDGACGGFPHSGAWRPEYALGLAQRAAN